MHTVVKKSSNNASIYLQEDGAEKGLWFYLSDRTKSFAEKLSVGTKIEIRTETKDGKQYIMFLKREGAPEGKKVEWKSKGSYGKSSYTKDPATTESIVKQTVMKASAEILASMVTNESVTDLLLVEYDKIFDHLYSKVKATAVVTPASEDGAVSIYDENDPNVEPAV